MGVLIASMSQFTQSIHTVNRDSNGPFEIKPMVGAHGPYTPNGRRLDELSSVDILLDSSTSVITTTGLSQTETSTSGTGGRAVVGLVAGGAGALMGGATARRTTDTSSTSTEIMNTELTGKLGLSDGHAMHAWSPTWAHTTGSSGSPALPQQHGAWLQ